MKRKLLSVLLCSTIIFSMPVSVIAAEQEDASLAQFDGIAANEEYSFNVIVKSNDSTYWQAAIDGMNKAAEELGVKITSQGPSSESDIADQVNMLNTAINSDYDAIALAANDATAVLDSQWYLGKQEQHLIKFYAK